MWLLYGLMLILSLLIFQVFSEFCSMGVPVFLMVSGVLLLNKTYDLDSFFKKKDFLGLLLLLYFGQRFMLLLF